MTALALLALAIWLYLLVGHGGFWLARERDEEAFPPPPSWPAVAAIVPARDEAAVIGRAIASLLAQDYPGPFRIVLVDDCSTDGTAVVARAAAAGDARLDVIEGSPPPRGWTGKLWALQRGIVHLATVADEFLWLSDADIVHAPDTLRRLVARSEAEGLVLNSLMARLESEGVAARALIPAFVFFFQMLYPFARVNRPGRVAGAAGGCMLVRRDALAQAGGLAMLANAIIDDCAMGRLMKRRGPIRLSLTRRARSIRPHGGWRSIGAMIARSAFAQLRYSPMLLAGTLAALGLVFIVPPVGALAGHGLARVAGLASWGLMAFAFQPMLRFYGRSPSWGVALPLIALFYAGATAASALRHWQGRGGMWKGRAHAARVR